MNTNSFSPKLTCFQFTPWSQAEKQEGRNNHNNQVCPPLFTRAKHSWRASGRCTAPVCQNWFGVSVSWDLWLQHRQRRSPFALISFRGPGVAYCPFLLNVSDESVLGGKQAHEADQLLHGFIADSLLYKLSCYPCEQAAQEEQVLDLQLLECAMHSLPPGLALALACHALPVSIGRSKPCPSHMATP
jgi:hypothetical protein